MKRRRRTKRSSNRVNIRKYVADLLRWPWFKHWHARDFVKWGLLSIFWLGVVMLVSIFVLSMGLPDIEKTVVMDQRPTVILRDYKGHEFARLGGTQNDTLKLKDMSPNLVHAVLAIEDRRFYSHFGVDPIGLARAIWVNFHRGGVVQGGSTITQQLAKNLFLTPDRTLMRKVKEALLALYLERRYTKDQILAAYLNRSYFGAGAYGVDAAARVYFNVTAKELTVPQAAMIAGLLKAPSRFSPDNDPKLAVERTRVVIAAMVDAGYLKPEAKKIKLAPLPKRDYQVGGSLVMRYFADWIMGQVEAYTGSSTSDLIIDTTLDTDMQTYSAATANKILDQQGEKLNIGQAALLTMTPDGAVRAMVGGRDYGTSQYNRAVIAKRQPGSSFKPIVYLTALEKNYTPETLVLDAPIRVGKYAPENFDGKYRGEITLQDAVANSLNSVAIRVAQDVGIADIKRMAQRLGVSDDLTSDLSLALGTSDVRMISLVGAYATLANRGLAVEPYGITSIRTLRGQVLYQRRAIAPMPVLNINTVAQMNKMLQGVVLYGTGQRAMIDRPVAGKTGTSSNYRDAWFIGYTSDFVCGVWVGNDDGALMKRVTGGSVPAQIWHDVMLQAHRDRPVQPLATESSSQGILPPEGDAASSPEGQGEGLFDQLLKGLIGAPAPTPPVTEEPAAVQ